MTDDPTPPAPKHPGGRPARSKAGASSGLLNFRVTAGERAELEEAAARAGLSVGGYIRSRVLAPPETRARRAPSVEVTALTRLQGEMNRVGSNIHQLLKRVNFGETVTGNEVREAFVGYRKTIAAILEALGRSSAK